MGYGIKTNCKTHKNICYSNNCSCKCHTDKNYFIELRNGIQLEKIKKYLENPIENAKYKYIKGWCIFCGDMTTTIQIVNGKTVFICSKDRISDIKTKHDLDIEILNDTIKDVKTKVIKKSNKSKENVKRMKE